MEKEEEKERNAIPMSATWNAANDTSYVYHKRAPTVSNSGVNHPEICLKET